MTLTIKDHIDQKHYPLDDKCRPLVPMQNGEVATILIADAPDGWKLWGYRSGAWPKRPLAWDVHGRLDTNASPCDWHLLPPAKVEHTLYAVYSMLDGRLVGVREDFTEANQIRRNAIVDCRIVTLTGTEP